MDNYLAEKIKQTALLLGYDKCGIIKITDMQGYAEKLVERIITFPEIKSNFQKFFNFAFLDKKYPWAKSVIICVRHYGKYHIPQHLNNMIAKYYLVDSREDKNSTDYQDSICFENYLTANGIKSVTDRKFGITSLRWAAMKAGLGVIRKNNFFYTEKGSWVYLEGWIIDKELELKEKCDLRHCSENCNLCIQACPTKSLNLPFSMNRSSCVSCITTWDGRDMPNEKYKKQLGNWIYGCDICQDVCPHNKNKWMEKYTFPYLFEIGEMISLEKILDMDYGILCNVIHPKFWYIGKKDIWKWKVNAINAMLNNWDETYYMYIEKATSDKIEMVRDMARYAIKIIDRTF
ncbi:Fe-S oxidoreductase [Clostridioides difficile]|nr:Fe-S oxidoreductase [Clostridioides difficile]